MSNKLLKIEEVAQMLGVGKSTIWYWLSTGKFIQPIKLGSRSTRWSLSDIEQFIANNRATL